MKRIVIAIGIGAGCGPVTIPAAPLELAPRSPEPGPPPRGGEPMPVEPAPPRPPEREIATGEPVPPPAPQIAAALPSGLRMPTPRSYLAVASAGGRIYTIGGIDDVSPGTYHASNAVEIFDPATTAWTAGAPAPIHRYSAGAAVIGTTIYVVGGHDNKQRLDAALAYDATADRWTTRRPMLQARQEPAVAAVDGKLYVFGGEDGRRYHDTVERYDPATNTWTERAAMPRERKGGAAVVVSGRVFLLGGISGDSKYPPQIDIYDPATDTWAVSPAKLPRSMWLPSAVAVGRSIVIAGGSFHDARTGMVDLAEVHVYDVTAAKLSALRPLAIGRLTHGAAVVGDKMYVLGGCRDGCNLKAPEIEIVSVSALAGATATRIASVPIARIDRATPAGKCPFADASTGLCWQDPPAEKSLTRGEAIAYCDAATDRGFTDWRLPTVDELVGLVRGRDMSACRAVDPQCLAPSCGAARPCAELDRPASPTGCYWDRALTGPCSWYHSSSKVSGAPYDSWFVYFDQGSLQWGAENLPKHVRCVRGSRAQIAK